MRGQLTTKLSYQHTPHAGVCSGSRTRAAKGWGAVPQLGHHSQSTGWGLSAMVVHSTAPCHACNLAQRSACFPPHPLWGHEGLFSLLLRSGWGCGW